MRSIKVPRVSSCVTTGEVVMVSLVKEDHHMIIAVSAREIRRNNLEDRNLLKLRSLDSSCPFFLSDNSIWGH